MAKASSWFQVDHEGLAATIEEPERLPLELYQNAVDENITSIEVLLRPVEGRRGVAELVATDDSPNGYADLTESYTLYAPSKKRDDATKRGRMNVGEKRVLALCEQARVSSTTGTVIFEKNGQRKRVAESREAGTVFDAIIRLKKVETDAAVELLRSVLPPKGITVTVNGQEVAHREPTHVFTETIATVLPDEDGKLTRNSKRSTEIHLHEPLPGEKPTLFEMGIPVVELDGDRWHVDVQQRVPLNTERDNVTPGYLRHLRTLVMNEMHSFISTEDANAVWAREAMGDERVKPEAVASVIHQRFGEKVVAFDPSDQEANKNAVAAGYVVVHGRSLSSDEWRNVKAAGIMQPAGQVTPSGSAILREQLRAEGGTDSVLVPEEKWTDGQRRMVAYAKALGVELLDYEPTVQIASDITLVALAWFGNRSLTLNVGKLTHRWFDQPDQQETDELLIHEFAHDRVADHLDDRFHDECCRLGAKMRRVTAKL